MKLLFKIAVAVMLLVLVNCGMIGFVDEDESEYGWEDSWSNSWDNVSKLDVGPIAERKCEIQVDEIWEEAMANLELISSVEYPLSADEMRVLEAACDEFSVDKALLLGLIEKETNFCNSMGDGGASKGYCQIQEKWWTGIMEEIGATDLMVPEDNFRTGCAIVQYLVMRYGSIVDALTAYNTGHGGASEYASDVLQFAEQWKAVMWDDAD